MLPSPTYGPGSANVPLHFGEQNPFLHFELKKEPQTEAKPSRRTLEPYVTGTSVLGIRYKDGVMLSADTLASYGSLARYRSIQRIKPVGKQTVIGCSGEISDFQYLEVLLEDLIDRDNAFDDGSRLRPSEIWNYITRVMYNRRNQFDPLWNQLVVAGYHDGKSFLGQVDSVGSSFEDDTLATGYGAYIARPLLRKAWKEGLSEKEAQEILEQSMRVLYYRDARTINKMQLAKITAEGISISPPYELATEWENNEAALGYPRPSDVTHD